MGSRGDPYTVEFTLVGTEMRVSCTCQAGQIGLPCKHRLALIDGDSSHVTGHQSDQMARLAERLRGTPLLAAHEAVRAAEADMDKAKRRLAGLKHALARTMTG